jgi:hypothetical protein
MMLSSARSRVAVVGRAHDEPAAGQALADVVVGVAVQPQVMPLGHERAEALPADPVKRILDGVVGQAVAAVPLGQISWPSIVPTVRLTLRIGRSISTGLAARSSAGSARR